MRYICVVLKRSFIFFVVIITILSFFGCTNKPKVVECYPGIAVSMEKRTGITISPEVALLLYSTKEDGEFVVLIYNLREFYADELSSFEYLGINNEAWLSRCYEEGISYEEFCTRFDEYKQATAAEEEFLHNLFYEDVGIDIGTKLENGFYETTIQTDDLYNSLLSNNKKLVFFICTKNEYLTYFNVPICQPN